MLDWLAALALTFQSSHLQDGMAEFLTMVRGCNLIAIDDTEGSESVFDVGSPRHSPCQRLDHVCFWLTKVGLPRRRPFTNNA